MENKGVILLFDVMFKSAIMDYRKAVANNDIKDIKEIEDWLGSQEVIEFMDLVYPDINMEELLSLCRERTLKDMWR